MSNKNFRALRVCLVSPLPPPYGGISHGTLMLLRHAESRDDVKFFLVDTAPRWRAIDNLNPYWRIMGGSVQLVRDLFVLLSVLFKKPDIVHLTTSGQLGVVHNLVMCIMARLFGVPVVYHIRFGRVPEIAVRNTLEWRLMVTVMHIADQVISITRTTTETIQHVLPKICVQYIPNPVGCAELALIGKGAPKLKRKTAFYLGWILPAKGIQELVQAWSEISPKDWDLVLAGPGSEAYQKKLVGRYHPLNLTFTGELSHDQAMQWMAACDIFLLPSYTEGFPNAILEAMTFGKAILATSVGAIPDMLTGECGLLIPPRDVEALKTALSRLMEDELLRSDYGARAREKVHKEYDLPIVFSRYVQVWESLASKG